MRTTTKLIVGILLLIMSACSPSKPEEASNRVSQGSAMRCVDKIAAPVHEELAPHAQDQGPIERLKDSPPMSRTPLIMGSAQTGAAMVSPSTISLSPAYTGTTEQAIAQAVGVVECIYQCAQKPFKQQADCVKSCTDEALRKEEKTPTQVAPSIPSPTPEFIAGFEAGVRYGLIVYRLNPQEDSIPALTAKAKEWYARVMMAKERLLDKQEGK